MTCIPNEITFFERLIPLVISGKKVITIRDLRESHYVPGSIVSVYSLETKNYHGKIKILAVMPIRFEQISDYHAIQEGMTLVDLTTLIKEIYPYEQDLYVIEYVLVDF